MNLEITVSDHHLGAVLGDLAQRRGSIREIQSRQDNKVVLASVPLAEMMVSAQPCGNGKVQVPLHAGTF